MQENTNRAVNSIFDVLNYNLFALGDAKITPLSILYILLLAILLVWLSGKIKSLLISRLLVRLRLDTGAQQAVGTIVRYAILFVGFLIILQTVGIDLTTLNVLAGAIGIGVGFGLQNVANNFISGLIVLLERPIKVGDRIEVGGVTGQVASVGARSTRIRTNDNIVIIIPNSKFISENVVNWSYESGMIRFRVPVAVAYDADLDAVSKILINTANENPATLSEPEPVVRYMKFDDSSVTVELRAYSRERLHQQGRFKSELYREIIRKFREQNIPLPDPQPKLYLQQPDDSQVELKVSTKESSDDSGASNGSAETLSP